VLLGSFYEFFLLSVIFTCRTLTDIVFCTHFLTILMQTRKFPANVLFCIETSYNAHSNKSIWGGRERTLKCRVNDLVGDNKILNLFYCK